MYRPAERAQFLFGFETIKFGFLVKFYFHVKILVQLFFLLKLKQLGPKRHSDQLFTYSQPQNPMKSTIPKIFTSLSLSVWTPTTNSFAKKRHKQGWQLFSIFEPRLKLDEKSINQNSLEVQKCKVKRFFCIFWGWLPPPYNSWFMRSINLTSVYLIEISIYLLFSVLINKLCSQFVYHVMETTGK